MPTPAHSIIFWAVPYGTSSPINVGNLVLPDSTATTMLVATSANRGTARSESIALTAFGGIGTGTVELQQTGTVDASISGLLPGTASWVRCSTIGIPERFTPVGGGTSDVIGYCEPSGRLHLAFGWLTETIITGGSSLPTGAAGGVLNGTYPNPGFVPGLRGQNWTTWDSGAGPVASWQNKGGPVLVISAVAAAQTTLDALSNPVDTIHITGTLGGTATITTLTGSLTPGRVIRIINDSSDGTPITLTLSDGVTAGSISPPPQTSGVAGNFTLRAGQRIELLLLENNIWDITSTTLYELNQIRWNGLNKQVPFQDSGGALGFSADLTFDKAAKVVAVTNGIQLDTGTVHTSAFIRYPYNNATTKVLVGAKASDASDQTIIGFGSGNALQFGNTAMNTTLNSIVLQYTAATSTNWSIGGVGTLESDGTKFGIAVPACGSAAYSMPFRFKVASITMTAGAGTATTLTAAQYECPILEITTTADGQQAILPNPVGAFFHARVVSGSATTLWLRKVAGSGGQSMTGSAGHGMTIYYSNAANDFVIMSAST